MGKSGRKFWKRRTGGNIKKADSLTIGGFGKSAFFQLVFFTVESMAETWDKSVVISIYALCGLVCRTDLNAAV